MTTDYSARFTTTDSGQPAPSDEFSLTAGPMGPILLQDHYLIQKMAQFNRERVPERVVHAKGSGAYGTFVVTDDVSAYTKADFLQPGRTTEMLARFSTVAGERGYADTVRDPRGFALKFYTNEGNYDLVGNNTPVFFVRDPQKFQDFIHSQKRRADNQLRDNEMQWDFWTLSPESTHQVMWLMGDRGLPRSYRHMNGYGSHTFQWINAQGERSWVKYHFKTDQGIEFLTEAQGAEMAGQNPDAHQQDLYESIRDGEFPSWTLYVQIMPDADAVNYRFNPFDLTKVWPHGDYPLQRVGTMTLNRNPDNWFAEIEQSAFEPSNFVPGIATSPDKMLLGRLFSYPDTHRYRIGPNYLQLPVNQPKSVVNSYNRDGAMRYSNPGDPVYAPNTVGGPKADTERFGDEGGWTVSGELVRSAYTRHAEDDDFVQATHMWDKVLDDGAKERLIMNIVGHMKKGVTPEMGKRVVEYWRNVHPDLGAGVEKGFAS